jgi:hypothetical protein
MKFYDQRHVFEAFRVGESRDPMPEWLRKAAKTVKEYRIGGTHYEFVRTDGLTFIARRGQWIVMQVDAPTTLRVFSDEDFKAVFTHTKQENEHG